MTVVPTLPDPPGEAAEPPPPETELPQLECPKFEDEAELLEHIEACSEPSEATTETFHVGSLYNYEPDHRFDANDNDTTSDEENKDGAPGA